MHNVLFVQYVFLPMGQAETYLKIYVLLYHLTYICPSLFGWKDNMNFVLYKQHIVPCIIGIRDGDDQCIT